MPFTFEDSADFDDARAEQRAMRRYREAVATRGDWDNHYDPLPMPGERQGPDDENDEDEEKEEDDEPDIEFLPDDEEEFILAPDLGGEG